MHHGMECTMEYTETTKVLSERQIVAHAHSSPIHPQSQWLSSLSESSTRRRRELLMRKQRQEKLRRRRMVRRREYQRLRVMVPSIATRPLVSKVTVIEEAIRYIDYLHGALLTRLRTKGLPNCLRDVEVDVDQLNVDGIKELVCSLVEKNNNQVKIDPPATTRCDHPVSYFERSRLLPTYLTTKRPCRKRT